MIRINLLERPRRAARSSWFSAQKASLLASLVLLATALFIGWRFWAIRHAAAEVEQKIARAEQEAARLRSLLQEVERFEKQRAQLQQRVALIEELRKGQTGPVHLLDEISRALPERLWLVELRQQNAEVRIDGRTPTLTALSDFVGNLEASGYFARPVEILDSQVETVQGVGDLVKFTIKAQFAMPGAPAPVTAPPAPPAKPPAAARR